MPYGGSPPTTFSYRFMLLCWATAAPVLISATGCGQTRCVDAEQRLEAESDVGPVSAGDLWAAIPRDTTVELVDWAGALTTANISVDPVLDSAVLIESRLRTGRQVPATPPECLDRVEFESHVQIDLSGAWSGSISGLETTSFTDREGGFAYARITLSPDNAFVQGELPDPPADRLPEDLEAELLGPAFAASWNRDLQLDLAVVGVALVYQLTDANGEPSGTLDTAWLEPPPND